MRKDVKLFINNHLVDCSENISLPMTYTIEDFKNPSIVKNSFSKTITIPGTKNNNKIFGEIYKLDRFIANHPNATSGVQFDPSKRVDFQIYLNSNLVESGYMQLNTISVINTKISYNITLYGGLGDFFYGLKYKEDGNIKTLADLQYFITDSSGNVLPIEDEFKFNINKELVAKCFENPSRLRDANELQDFLTFIPAYNGLYDNFDNETCLINTFDSEVFPDSHNGFTTYNGYALAKLNKPYTEWQMRDLRSYMQRPAIKLSKLIETICREENSGYNVEFDNDFFNNSNPYWSRTYVALPLLGSSVESGTDEITESAQLIKYDDDFWTGTQDGVTIDTNTGYFAVRGSSVITSTNEVINLTNVPKNSLVNIDVTAQMLFNAENGLNNDLYLSYVLNGRLGPLDYKNYARRASITVQLLAYDVNDLLNPLAYSPLYNFTNTIQGNIQSGPSSWYNYYPLTDAKVEDVLGHFVKHNDNTYVFNADNGSNIFHFTIKDMPKVDQIKLVLNINRRTEYQTEEFPLYSGDNLPTGYASNYKVNGYNDMAINDSAFGFNVKWASNVSSEAQITKQDLLKTESTPADFLLSYAKLFGLYFTKDIDSKTIRIYTRNNFFKNSLNDWSGRIDYSKDFTINPLLFDKKWYTMALQTPETYYANKYNKQYDIVYGQQRMDTGYSFNADNTDLYADNVFENIVPVRDVDKYYRTFYNSNDVEVPAFMNDNIEYNLFNADLSQTDTQTLYGADFIDVQKTTEWYNVPGNDVFAKNCFYSLNNNEQNLEEIKSSLVMYNGDVTMTDIDGNYINYWITDDVVEMSMLNEGENCFIYTNSEYNADNEKIAIKCNILPQFVRYVTVSNDVSFSLDFGLPREIYVDNIEYGENATIYNTFWKAFYNDQFDVNTKKITCFVKLNDLDVKYDLMRQFYYFEDSYWILNKIDAYDVTSDNTTRCEFIKVQDMNSYLYGVGNLGDYIKITPNYLTLPATEGSVTVKVASNQPWEVAYYPSSKIQSITPSSGDRGVTDVTINYTANNLLDYYASYIRFEFVGRSTGEVMDFKQLPSEDNTVLISGTVRLSNNNIPPYRVQICASNDNFTNCDFMSESGTYSLYAQKGVPFTFKVENASGDVISTETLTLNENLIKNIVI